LIRSGFEECPGFYNNQPWTLLVIIDNKLSGAGMNCDGECLRASPSVL
jgi:hypothetical protein